MLLSNLLAWLGVLLYFALVLEPNIIALVLLFKPPAAGGEADRSQRIVRRAAGAALLVGFLPCYIPMWAEAQRYARWGGQDSTLIYMGAVALGAIAANIVAVGVWAILYWLWRRWHRATAFSEARFGLLAFAIAIGLPLSIWAAIWAHAVHS